MPLRWRWSCPGCREAGTAAYPGARCFLNAEAVLAARNASCAGSAVSGYLVLTPGNATDVPATADDMLEFSRCFGIVCPGTNSGRSMPVTQRLRAQRIDMVAFRSTTPNVSPTISRLDATLRSGRLQPDGNPRLACWVGSVVGTPDRRGNRPDLGTADRRRRRVDDGERTVDDRAGATHQPP